MTIEAEARAIGRAMGWELDGIEPGVGIARYAGRPAVLVATPAWGIAVALAGRVLGLERRLRGVAAVVAGAAVAEAVAEAPGP